VKEKLHLSDRRREDDHKPVTLKKSYILWLKPQCLAMYGKWPMRDAPQPEGINVEGVWWLCCGSLREEGDICGCGDRKCRREDTYLAKLTVARQPCRLLSSEREMTRRKMKMVINGGREEGEDRNENRSYSKRKKKKPGY
jgi:hypothetical protein